MAVINAVPLCSHKTFSKNDIEAFQLLQIPTWIMDCETMKCIWGNEASRILWKVDCMLEVDWTEASLQTRQRLKNKLVTLVNNGNTKTWELWNVYPKGIPTKLKCNYAPIKLDFANAEPDKYYLLMYCFEEGEVTEDQSRASEVLNYSESLFSMYTTEGETLFTNAAAETRRRYDATDFQFRDHFHEQERDKVLVNLFDKFSSLGWGEVLEDFNIQRDYTAETLKQFSLKQEISNNDEEKWWRVIVKKVRDVSSGNSTILVQEEDITELKRIQKKLEIADSAKNSFLANMSHELRTPVNGIIGILDYVINWTELTCDQKSCLQTAVNSGEGLLKLLNDVLDFSKISAGQLSIVKEAYSVAESIGLVESVCELLSFSVKENVILYSEFNPLLLSNSFSFQADCSRIRQILLNLVGNAIKFTLSGSIKVEVDFVVQPVRNNKGLLDSDNASDTHIIVQDDLEYHLQILVSDSGIGIGPNKLEQIFEEFVQADSSTTRKYGGTGLGLSISRRLANLMNGDVFVSRSIEGVGSTFAFYMPTGVKAHEVKLYCDDPSLNTLPVQKVTIVVNLENKDVAIEFFNNYFIQFNVKIEVLHNIEELRDSPNHLILILTESSISQCFFNKMYEFKLKHEPNSHFIAISPFRKETKTDENLLKLADKVITLPIKLSQFHTHVKELNFMEKQKEKGKLQMQIMSEPIINRLRDRGGCKILLADDNSVNRLIICKYLKELSIDPLIAKDGREAVNIYSANEDIDLILMDLNMPEISGSQVTSMIREEEKKQLLSSGVHNHIPIIGITADESARETCLNSGMDYFLSKPFRFPQIAHLLETWIK